MKQYTDKIQTAQLIELGFEKPSPKWVKDENGDYRVKTNDADYDIGELIAYLPQFMDFDDGKWSLSIEADPFKVNGTWWVFYEPSSHTESVELIDAIFDMCIKLKDKGVI